MQRPGVRSQVREQLDAFADIAETLEEHTELGRKMNLVGAIERWATIVRAAEHSAQGGSYRMLV